MAGDASNQSTDMESAGMQKQVEDMFRSECSGEEANASIKSPGPEGLHTMLTTHHPDLLIGLDTIRETYSSMKLPSDASFDARAFNHFMDCIHVATDEEGKSNRSTERFQAPECDDAAQQ